jgi:hypothetical protein
MTPKREWMRTEMDLLRDRAHGTAYICPVCRAADAQRTTHPGVRHLPGVCECRCRIAEIVGDAR